MTNTVIPIPPSVLLPIADRTELFPVRRVYCVGRNYADHAIEMGHDPKREAPFFFQKNADDLLVEGNSFPYPQQSADVHYEVESVVLLQAGGENISVDEAMKCVYGYAVGIDFTRRDLQAQAKKLGRPWEVAKAFRYSAPISKIVSVDQVGHPSSGRIWLDYDGERKQDGDLHQMIWSVPEIISELPHRAVILLE